MNIVSNQVVGLTYELNIKNETDEWQLIETASTDNPMYFIYGMSGLPEAFETRIAPLSVGTHFEFTLSPEEGYGDFDSEAVIELPLDVFMVDGKIQDDILQVGNMIPMTNEDDSRLVGQVVEISDELVVMDFNHPLAGREMAFKGQIIEIRNATAEELEQGHVHGMDNETH